jgi:excisionase family DNA binding protein
MPKRPTAPLASGERLLTVAEAAHALGMSRKTLYGWAAQRRVPTVKLFGRALRFRASDLERLIVRSMSPAMRPLAGGADSAEPPHEAA